MAADFGFKAYNVDQYSDPFVFISYKSEDWEQVAVYARCLHDNGINVWYDEGLHSGVDWESYLMSVIEKESCRAVLLFLSAKVAGSTVIPLETTQARACKKPTVAVHLEPGLDIGQLLNKAIKVYVEQRQAVKAYDGSRESVCAEVLEAARNAMNNVETAVDHRPVEELWQNARMFLNNGQRSRSEEDAAKARGFLLTMTEQYPADYRGWHGLALCECLPRVRDLESAAARLEKCSKYYSYVVAAGADGKAGAEYTQCKSRMWDEINSLIELQAENVTSDFEAKQLLERITPLKYRMGHTESRVKTVFDSHVEDLNDVLSIGAEYSETSCKWNAISNTEVELVEYSGTLPLFEIPERVEGRRVVRVCVGAFSGCTTLREITVPSSVGEIGVTAFDNCTQLKSVKLSEGLKSIGIYAFRNCNSLEDISIPESVVRIGAGAFALCSSLKSITLPDGLEFIGAKVFRKCGKQLTVRAKGGYFSKEAKCARKSGVKYSRIS